MDTNSARAGLQVLSSAHHRRELAYSRHPRFRDADSDDDADLESPVFDSFYNADGNEGVLKMTNFTAAEFRVLYGKLHSHLATRWNVGRGRKCAQKPMDVFFMTLTVLKHGGAWDILAKVFRMKGPTFERMIVCFMRVLASRVDQLFVQDVGNNFTMAHLREKKRTFKSCEFAVEAIDVTFQQANRPSGNMQEGKVYFSGKHKLYGYKVEVAVRSNGLASAYSKHYAGSVSDITILTKRIEEHRLRLEKGDEDKDIDDVYFMSDEYPNHWAFLADKGYQGAQEMIRCVIPFKKPARGVLSADQEKFNRDLSSDRILVENYFGRMLSLWNVMSQKWTWSETLYDTVVCMCVGLTNIHVDSKPLRSVDSDWYNRYMNRLLHIGDSRKRKRAETQAMYRERRKQRLRVGYRVASTEDDETQEEYFSNS
eukprot:IDg21823t1